MLGRSAVLRFRWIEDVGLHPRTEVLPRRPVRTTPSFPSYRATAGEFARHLGSRFGDTTLAVLDDERLTYREAEERAALLAKGLSPRACARGRASGSSRRTGRTGSCASSPRRASVRSSPSSTPTGRRASSAGCCGTPTSRCCSRSSGISAEAVHRTGARYARCTTRSGTATSEASRAESSTARARRRIGWSLGTLRAGVMRLEHRLLLLRTSSHRHHLRREGSSMPRRSPVVNLKPHSAGALFNILLAAFAYWSPAAARSPGARESLEGVAQDGVYRGASWSPGGETSSPERDDSAVVEADIARVSGTPVPSTIVSGCDHQIVRHRSAPRAPRLAGQPLSRTR